MANKTKIDWDALETDFNKKNEQFKILLNHDHNVLGRILKCHLIIEHYLDLFLKTECKIRNIEDAQLTFYQKAKLLPDDHPNILFIKPGILKVSSIRNMFGHNLGATLDSIKIDPINYRNRVGEYGILMGDRTEWRKGYAKEATLTIINYCFSGNENLRKITLGVVEDNITAVKLYEDIGFEIEGRYKHHAYHDSKWCNVLRMAIFNPAIVG